MDYNKDDILLLQDDKSKIAKARKLVKDTCKHDIDNISNYVNVCSMLELHVDEYNSIQGKVYIIYENKRYSIHKIIMNGIAYENIKKVDICYEMTKKIGGGLDAYLVNNTLLFILDNFVFTLDTYDSSTLGYFVKGNTSIKLSAKQINKIFNTTKSLHIGTLNLGALHDFRHIIAYNNKIYNIKFQLYFGNGTQQILLLNNNQLYFIDTDKFYNITINEDDINTIYKEMYSDISRGRWINSKIFIFSTILVDMIAQKIYMIDRGLWESKVRKDRYILNINTEYIGVIVEETCAIYDIVDKKCYFANDNTKDFLAPDGAKLENSSSIIDAFGAEKDIFYCNYLYRESTKEEFLASLESSGV